MQRDQWTCTSCETTDKPLQVHHWYYVARNVDRMPWEYPNHALTTMCDDCHKAQKQRGAELNEFEAMIEDALSVCRGQRGFNEVIEVLRRWFSGEKSGVWMIEKLKQIWNEKIH